MWRRFDEAYYLDANPDVAVAVKAGIIESGRRHFDRYGHSEGRPYSYRTLLPSLSSYWEYIRPKRNHFSGILLSLLDRPIDSATIMIRVRRVSRRGVQDLRSASVRLDQIAPGRAFPVYWKPIEESRDRRFIVTATAASSIRPIRFTLDRSPYGLIYSSPTAESALPEHLLISPVTQCNLNCIHCISRHSRLRFAKMSDAMWAEIAEGAAAGAFSLVRSDYSGDIIFDHVRHGGWLDRIIALDVDYGITTHGNDLTEEIARKLLASRLCDINFSIDSLDPEDYQRIRRGGRPIGEVLDRIRMFMALRNRMRPDLPVSMSYVLMRRNLEAVDAALAFAAETGIAFQAPHLHAWTPDMVKESLLPARATYAEAFGRLTAVAQQRGVVAALPEPVQPLAPRRTHAPCPVPWQSAVVLGDGDVMACCVPGTKVGSLHDASLKEIWNGPEMQAFRVRVNSDDPPEPCLKCPMMRVPNNYASYAPCLSGAALDEFETRCAATPPSA
jgi:radical SAM protein with 4Fe4S-binding SPASM domain